MTQQLHQYQQCASFYRAALLLGLTTGEVVVAWADGVISHDSDAPSGMFDVAMVAPADLSELRHALQPLAGRGESGTVVCALFDIVRLNLMDGQRNMHDTITVLAQARRFITLSSEYFDQIDTLQDDLMLATAGVVGDTAEVEGRVRMWLAQFEGGKSRFLEESS